MKLLNDIPLRAVASILPASFSDRLACLTRTEMLQVEELRLRNGHPMTALLPGGECPLGGKSITESDLRNILECATKASTHTVLEQMQKGFVTLKGGHRIGLCGTINRRDGSIMSLRYLSSMAIRIARAVEGVTGDLMPHLVENGQFQSTLILGPPGSGKTTLLRELIRTISDGKGVRPHRVGLADERGEVAALWEGQAQFRIGCQTDVMDGCPKAEGMSTLLRGMNPQVLAVDEITHPADIDAMTEASGCGVSLLATAHGGNLSDLVRRPVYRKMMSERIFRHVVLLENMRGVRRMKVENLE